MSGWYEHRVLWYPPTKGRRQQSTDSLTAATFCIRKLIEGENFRNSTPGNSQGAVAAFGTFFHFSGLVMRMELFRYEIM